MKLSRFAALTSAFFVTSALALTGASAAASAQLPTATGYVALGDSYSSGVGAGSYDSASGSCKRSAKSYPALWAAAHSPSSFRFAACSGARTGDVLSSQLGPLSSTTGLVSITIGGNDAGFADTMTTCALQGESACLARVAQARTYIDNTLPGRLDGVYSAISQKAPAARVVVLGYPHFYRLNGTCIVGLSEKSRAAINAAADDINGVTAKRAADHGFSFADVNATFSGHELCSGSAWLHSVTFPVEESYHPTAAGQSGGYLPVFASAA
ncbi:SGNH/GDSL hydrolase family protein [Streptomyces auratus]|uniref:triacylglycerol lipase n=1 Tax=Streptomyces auratus AGR0001 TaxID=1160718 RepID=J1ZNB3_9ACTN|nr:SGNH/GDSL hydrolase family protein [Streptomyces auratus]QTZ91148.1 SGNH/GDSL hydrolase family protein [Streptomyces auratus AGR0001]